MGCWSQRYPKTHWPPGILTCALPSGGSPNWSGNRFQQRPRGTMRRAPGRSAGHGRACAILGTSAVQGYFYVLANLQIVKG
jgi:hypothetical protein